LVDKRGKKSLLFVLGRHDKIWRSPSTRPPKKLRNCKGWYQGRAPEKKKKRKGKQTPANKTPAADVSLGEKTAAKTH